MEDISPKVHGRNVSQQYRKGTSATDGNGRREVKPNSFIEPFHHLMRVEYSGRMESLDQGGMWYVKNELTESAEDDR